MSQRLVEIAIKAKDESKGAFTSLENSLQGGTAKTALLVAGLAALAVATYKAGEELYEFVSEMAAAGDEMDKMSQRTGIAVDTLSELQFAAERGGGSIQDVETATRRLSRAMQEATQGGERQAAAFRRLGIDVRDLVGPDGELVSFEAILPRLADGLAGLGSQASRMDLAQELFGRGGTALLPMLQQGADGIREMRVELEKYGGAMDAEFSAKSAAFVDAQTNLATATDRLKEALAEPFLAPFTAAVNKLAETIAIATGSAEFTIDGLIGKPAGWVPTESELMEVERANIEAATGKLHLFEHERAVSPGAPRPWEAALEGDREAEYQRLMDSVAAQDAWYDSNKELEHILGSLMDVQSYDDINASIGHNLELMGDLDTMFMDVGFNIEELTSGLGAMSESASWSAKIAEDAAVTFKSSFTANLDGAFYEALTDTRAFGRAFVDALKRTFADTLAQIGSRVVSTLLPIPGGDKALVSNDTKGMPGASAMMDAGRQHYDAGLQYGKAYL